MNNPRLSFRINLHGARFSIGLLLALSFLPASVLAGKVLVVQKSSDGKFTFISADELLINDSRKIKLISKSDSLSDTVTTKALPKVEISGAGVIKGDGKGALFAITGGESKRVLPENFTAKEMSGPGSLQVPLEVTVVKDRKGKDSVVVPTQTLYICMPGEAEPERAAEAFVVSPENFSNLDQQLSAMEGFTVSFPGSPATDELRISLERQLQNAIHTYDAGGTYQSLLDTKRIAEMAVKAFSSDRSLLDSAKQIDSMREQTLKAARHLQDLAAIEDWADLLTAYQDFGLHADSFPEIQTIHRRALEEKVHMDCRNGRALLLRKNENEAVRKFSEAAEKDPTNPEIQKQREGARILATKSTASQNQNTWTPLPKDSPEEHLFRQAIYNATRAIQEHDYAKAKEEILQAERQSANAPDLLLTKASLLASGPQMAEALPLLYRYDSAVTEPGAREKGDTLRNQVLYELRKRKEATQHDINELLQGGNYSRAYVVSTAALKEDPSNPALLHAAGISASVLAKTAEADTALKSYLKYSDNLASDSGVRQQVRQLLVVLSHPAVPEGSGMPNWFSGKKLPEGVYYCPLSLAFQIPIESVAGFKSRTTYSWEHGRLMAIRTEFEDEKGQANYRAMVSRIGPKGSNETASFVFTYDPKGSSVRSVYAAESGKNIAPFDSTIHLLKSDDGSVHLVDAKGNAQAVLPNNPSLDTEVVRHLLGNVTTIMSGNSFFNPFIWDGVHYFTATYDSEGRISAAKEWNTDNVLHFSWEHQRLLAISAFHGKENEPYYERTISYNGTNISSEEYTSSGHNGRIKYQYSKDVLTAVKIEDGGVHDGKSWTARLQPSRELGAR